MQLHRSKGGTNVAARGVYRSYICSASRVAKLDHSWVFNGQISHLDMKKLQLPLAREAHRAPRANCIGRLDRLSSIPDRNVGRTPELDVLLSHPR